MNALEAFASASALIYVYLAGRDNNWCWAFAAVSAAVWTYVSYFDYALISDALLQLFYLVMAGVGLWRWTRGRGSAADARPIVSMSPTEHLLTLAGGLGGGLLLGYVVGNSMQAAATYPDAITTVFSVIATFLLIGRRLENWLYWIVIDAAYVWIYLRSGANVFALLMLGYVIMAGVGYYRWRSPHPPGPPLPGERGWG